MNIPNGKSAAILGATGLTGGLLSELIASDDYFESVRLISRKPIPVSSPKISNVLFDSTDENSLKQAIGNSEVIFCAVGTTNRKVKGDLSEYRKVDFNLPVWAARHGAGHGCRHFVLVSAVGADAQSSNYYLKLKGETEEAVRAAGIPAVSVLRPSLLLGKRKEFRPLEIIGRLFMQPFSFLIPSRYKPVTARMVASAMMATSKKTDPGFHVLHYREIMDLAKN